MISSIYIAKNVYGGDGIGRLGDGRVVFVPGTFASEQVKAEIVQEKRNFVKARLVEIEEPSPERIGTGPMPIPGMVYSNLSVAGECAAKGAQLAEFFERARIELPSDVDLSRPAFKCDESSAFNYRNKVVYHFEKKGTKLLLGYRCEPSHEIVDVLNDPLARPEINAALPNIRDNVFRLVSSGPLSLRKSIERKANVTIRWSERSGVVWWMGDAPKDVLIRECTCGKVFEVPSDGFYQINPSVGEALVKSVVAKFASAPTREVLDLYCGVGVFGLCMSPNSLVGVESGHRAIEFAKKNAQHQGAQGAKFFAQEASRNFHKLRITDQTTVVVDPPRGGLEYVVARSLAKCAAPRIFYVSCDPATLTRDLKVLLQNYKVQDVEWFNMFPRTARFETLVTLIKK